MITQDQVADTYVPKLTEIIQTQLFKIKLANIKSAYSTSPYLSCGNYHKGSWPRQEYWNGFPCPPPGDLPNPGIEPMSLMSPALADMSFTTSTT